MTGMFTVAKRHEQGQVTHMSASIEIQPASRRNLAESVEEQIISLVLEGKLKPGDRLPSQQDLAGRFEVGLSTIREALGSLASIGLVETRHGQGTFVQGSDLIAIARPDVLARIVNRDLSEQLLEMRQIIEPEIARLAAERATEEDLAAIREALSRCDEAIQAGRPVYRISAEVHRAITQATHNRVFSMVINSILTPLVERGLLLEKKAGFAEWELGSHQRVCERIAQGDGEGARLAMARHLEESKAALLEMLSQANLRATQ